MSNTDVLSSYARYQAANAIIRGASSTTNANAILTTEDEGREGTVLIEADEGDKADQFAYQIPWRVRSAAFTESEATLELLQESLVISIGDFSVLDSLRTAEGQIRQQIRSLRGARWPAYRERLARRLDDLLHAMEEEQEAWSDDSSESLRMMLLFLQTVPSFQCPTITITPRATFRAQWTVDSNRHFAADFLPDGQVQFVVFCPDPRHLSRFQRISGVTSRELLLSAVAPCRVQRWAVDAGR